MDSKNRILLPANEDSFDQIIEDDSYVWVPEEAGELIDRFFEMKWDENIIKNFIINMMNDMEDLKENVRSLQKEIKKIKKSARS